MAGVFLAVNTTGFRVALTVLGANAQTDLQLLLEGPLPTLSSKGNPAAEWGSVALQVAGEAARGMLYDAARQEWRVMFEGLAVPAPRAHFTGKVAGKTVQHSQQIAHNIISLNVACWLILMCWCVCARCCRFRSAPEATPRSAR